MAPARKPPPAPAPRPAPRPVAAPPPPRPAPAPAPRPAPALRPAERAPEGRPAARPEVKLTAPAARPSAPKPASRPVLARPAPRPALARKPAQAPGRGASRPVAKDRQAPKVTFTSLPGPKRGQVKAKPGVRPVGKRTAGKVTKPKVIKGRRKPGSENHGPAAGYDQAQEQSAFTDQQTQNIITCLEACHQEGADYLATMALMCLGFGENSWQSDGCNASDHCGVFQLDTSWQAMHDYRDVGYWARYALLHGFYGYGGIIPISVTHPEYSPGKITNMCQGAYTNLDTGAAYYDGYESDARWAIKTYGPRAGDRILASGVQSTTGLALTGDHHVSGAQAARLLGDLNWGGLLENAFKYMVTGADQAVTMSTKTRDRIRSLTVIDWTGETKHR